MISLELLIHYMFVGIEVERAFKAAAIDWCAVLYPTNKQRRET